MQFISIITIILILLLRFMAKQGFIEKEGLDACFDPSVVNPIALTAVFEALTGGGGSVADPKQVASKIASWGGSAEGFKNDLTLAVAKRSTAYLSLLGLIALVFDLIIESGIYAFL
jgi:hypothetical protein